MPGIGLTVVGRVGPVTLYVFGITVAAGALVGMAVTLMQARRFGLSGAKVFEVSAPALVTGVIGARLAYVIANFSDYRPALTAAINLTEGGFAFYGGLAGGMAVAAWYAPRLRLSFGRVVDAAAPGLAIGQAIGLVGVHLAGRETAVPWGMVVDGRVMHPFPAYGIILAYGIFFVVWRLGGRAGRVRPGRLFLVYLLLHGLGTAVVGTWAAGARWGGLTPGQWAGLAVGAVALAGLLIARRGALPIGAYVAPAGGLEWRSGQDLESVGGPASQTRDDIATAGSPASHIRDDIANVGRPASHTDDNIASAADRAAASTVGASSVSAEAGDRIGCSGVGSAAVKPGVVRPDPTRDVDIAKVYGLRYTSRPRSPWERVVGPAAWLAGLSLLLILFRARL